MPKFVLLAAFAAVLPLLFAPSAAQAAPASRATSLSGAASSQAASLSRATSVSRAASLSRAASHSRAASLSAAQAALLRGRVIVAAAGAQKGKPYRHGAAGPRAFDCSGLSGYAYRAAHIRLPRTSNAQYRAARPVSRATARPGDLVFWVHGRSAYHVGVFAGAGRVWHAPKPGDRVRLAKIWSPREVRFGRIGA